MTNHSKFKFYLLLGIIFISILATIFFKIYYSEVKDFLIYFLSNSRYIEIYYIILFFISSFFSIPFLTFLAGAVFPFWKALYLSLIGNIITFVLMFYFSRFLGRDYVQRFSNKYHKIKELDISLHKNAIKDIFLLRLFFLLPPEATNILSGISSVNFWRYMIGSVLGLIPLSIFSILLVQSKIQGNNLLFIFSGIAMILMIIFPPIFIKSLRIFFKKPQNKIISKINKIVHN